MRDYEFAFSETTFAELERVINYPRVQKDVPDRGELMEALRDNSMFVSPEIEHVGVCKHNDDDKFIDVAVEVNAIAIVTANLKHFPKESYKGIPIIHPRKVRELYKERKLERGQEQEKDQPKEIPHHDVEDDRER